MPLNEVWRITETDAECVGAYETPEEARRYLLSHGAVFAGMDCDVYMFTSAVEKGVQFAVQDTKPNSLI